MVLLTHIIIALLSLGVSTYALFRPAPKTFNTSYAFIAATLASGTVLAVTDMSHLVQACLSGITYIVGVSALTAFAHRQYAKQEIKK